MGRSGFSVGSLKQMADEPYARGKALLKRFLITGSRTMACSYFSYYPRGSASAEFRKISVSARTRTRVGPSR
jgi:hypothetical protein